MKRRKRESSEDKTVSGHFFLRPRTIIHLLLVIAHLITVLLGACYNSWPRYCFRNNWAYFSVIGLHVSATVNILSTFLTYVIFEDLNWVLISILLVVYGGMFTLCGILYIGDDITGCAKCRIPVLGMTGENFQVREARWRDKHSIETTVAYSTFILGVLYVIILSYYLARRERA